MAFLTAENIYKEYPNSKILDNINIKIQAGEFISVFGPNGCGKTTLLNILSGLDTDYSGSINFKGKIKKGFIFQNTQDSLLPWKTIAENLKLDNKNIEKEKLKKILEELNLWNFRDNYPYQLSGGMKQLLAIARSFIHGCNFLLLDEPFSSLDYYKALEIRETLLKLWEKEKPTVLFVSHDIDETIILSDKIILLSKRPAKIKEIIEVKLPRPRNRSTLTSKKFLEYKKKILESMKNETG